MSLLRVASSLSWQMLLAISFLVLSPPLAEAQDKLKQVEDRVKQHVNQVRQKLQQKEQSIKQLATSEQQKWREGEQYQVGSQQHKGPEKHEWMKRGGQQQGNNPESQQHYLGDSWNAWDGEQHLTQTWSCFQPQLVAIQENCVNVIPRMAEVDLGLACLANCCLDNPFTAPQDGWEVIQFWFPEHQAAVNNYARNRLDPTDPGITGQGQQFIYKTLTEKKPTDANVDEKMKMELEQTYKLSLADFKEPNRKEPFIGQYQLGGAGPGMWSDHYGIHTYRTHIAAELGDKKPETHLGWQPEPLSILDALAPKTSEMEHLHIWSEYGIFDALTTVDSLWFTVPRNDQRIQKLMKAALERRGDLMERAKENPAGYQNKKYGPARFRVAKWADTFNPLQQIAKIQPDQNDELREIVYHGGTELYPASASQEGFEVPHMTMRATAGRRGFEIAGNHELSKLFPNREKGRANTYTIDHQDKGREIDKMQMIYPLLGSGTPSECFRSQKMPSMLGQTEDQWAKKNLPMDHMGYMKDDKTDSTFIYWNKRVACTCRIDGLIGGSVAMDFPDDGIDPKGGRGTGDRTYGRIENKLCEYREGALPSAWAGKDMPSCESNPNTKTYEGLQDNI